MTADAPFGPRAPFVPGQLARIADFEEWQDAGFVPSSHVELDGLGFPAKALDDFELSESAARGVFASDCAFQRALFADVLFEGCDLSNSDFDSAMFERCRFVSCKLVGVQACSATFSNVVFEDCTLRFAALNRSRFRDVRASGCDFGQADLSESRFSGVEAKGCSFEGASFFKTPLSGVDLSDCRIDGLVLSETMRELKGCRMDFWQAVGVAKRLGVIVDS